MILRLAGMQATPLKARGVVCAVISHPDELKMWAHVITPFDPPSVSIIQMISPIHTQTVPMRSPLHAHTINTNPNANLNHLVGLSFSDSTPQQKGFLQKKVLPVIRRVGSVAGKVSDIAGKVAVVASIL